MLNFLKRLFNKLTGTITVVIPVQSWDQAIYNNNTDCYLATALKDAGYKKVIVQGNGYTHIGENYYKPTKEFNGPIVREHLCNNQPIKVTLKKLS